MKCYVCDAELIWGGDDDTEEFSNYLISTNLSCPECRAFVLVYHGEKENELDL